MARKVVVQALHVGNLRFDPQHLMVPRTSICDAPPLKQGVPGGLPGAWVNEQNALQGSGGYTHAGGLFLAAKSLGMELLLDLPGKQGRTLSFQLGNTCHHSGGGQAGLAPPSPLGLQDTCTVVPSQNLAHTAVRYLNQVKIRTGKIPPGEPERPISSHAPPADIIPPPLVPDPPSSAGRYRRAASHPLPVAQSADACPGAAADHSQKDPRADSRC